MRGLDIQGRQYNRLTVVERAHRKHNQTMWLCVCVCGRKHFAPASALAEGRVKSCGCLNQEMRMARNTRHGMSPRDGKHRMYGLWYGMIRRCRDPNFKGYKYYGGKGVTVCERWRDFGAFLADMGERPSAAYSLDRIDSSGNYEPGNCRWATWAEQNAPGRHKRLAL